MLFKKHSRLHIIAGAKQECYGTGHVVRMQRFREYLKKEHPELQSDLYNLHTCFNRPANEVRAGILAEAEHWPVLSGILLIDARDINPHIFNELSYVQGGELKIVALDNNYLSEPGRDFAGSKSTENIFYYHTLPSHLSREDRLSRVLVDPAFVNLKRPPAQGHVLVYTGSEGFLSKQQVKLLTGKLSKIYKSERIRLISAGSTGLKYALSESSALVTYFGMTLFEAWAAGRKTAGLLTGKQPYDSLLMNLNQRYGLPVMDPVSDTTGQIRAALEERPLPQRPGVDGMTGLVKFLAEVDSP